MSTSRPRLPPRRAAALLLVALPALWVLSVRVGATGAYPLSDVLQGCLAALGMGEPLDGARQIIVELRLWRTLTTTGVGAALAFSGALIQGLFRNGLAAPSILGVTGGASLGATLAILVLGMCYGLLMAFQGHPERRRLGYAVAGLFCAFLEDGLFGFNLRVPVSAGILFLMMGLLDGLWSPPPDAVAPRRNGYPGRRQGCP